MELNNMASSTTQPINQTPSNDNVRDSQPVSSVTKHSGSNTRSLAASFGDLYRLPPELRRMIYKHVFHYKNPVSFSDSHSISFIRCHTHRYKINNHRIDNGRIICTNPFDPEDSVVYKLRPQFLSYYSRARQSEKRLCRLFSL